MKYEGLRDKHLNPFIIYGSNKDGLIDNSIYLENNITKALINTIQSLCINDKKIFFKKMFGIDVLDTDDFQFYLQKKPNKWKEIINDITKENRILFCFCPDGSIYGNISYSIKDKNKILNDISNKLDAESPYLSKTEKNVEINKRWNEIKNNHNGSSIPDAWIIVSRNKKYQFAIIMENKKIPLDPFQINNHLEKSLLLEKINEKRNAIIQKKYFDIAKCLNEISLNSYLINSFIEYLIICGLLDDFVNFEDAFYSDKDIRKELSSKFGEKIMSKLNLGKVDSRNKYTTRIKVHYYYLHEINLCFGDDFVFLSLAFGPTQNSAKIMLNKIDLNKIKKLKYVKNTFHLQYNRGRNISGSYVSNWNIHDYVLYWKNNINELYLRTPNNAIDLYKKMLSDNKITFDDYSNIKKILRNRKSRINIVPEIIAEPRWDYDYVAKIGINDFINEMKDTINEYLTAFDL